MNVKQVSHDATSPGFGPLDWREVAIIPAIWTDLLEIFCA